MQKLTPQNISFRLSVAAVAVTCVAISCTSPSKIEISPDKAVLDAAGKMVLLQAEIKDQDGNAMSSKGYDIIWSTEDNGIVSVTPFGQVTAKASGTATVKAEIDGTDIFGAARVEVRIPFAVQFSKDKVRLIKGETVDNIRAEVVTSKGVAIEGLTPTFSAEDSSVVEVQSLVEASGRGFVIKLTGKNPGTSQVTARLNSISASLRVAVFEGDEEINLAGDKISKKKQRDARRGIPKKEKAQSFAF